MSSRDIADLTPRMQILYKAFSVKMEEAGLSFIVTCTARSEEEQTALYAQGRKSLSLVNNLRKEAGLPPITDKENRNKVTWTMKSKHITNAENPKSRAFDIALTVLGKTTWDIKVNVNKNKILDYEEAARIGESVGLKAGARFSSPDYPHFEDPNA